MRTRKQVIVVVSAVLCFTGISSAQNQASQSQASQNQVATAPQAASTTLTPRERDAAIKQFEATRDNFLKSIAGLSEKQWTFKPAPDRWSVAEVSEHITISEITLFGLVQKTMQTPATPERREQVKGKDEMILQRVPDRSHKAQAPEFLKPTDRWPTEADLTKAFEQARAANINYIRTTNDDLRDHFFDHPVFGTLDDYQWLLLIAAHSARHTQQIEEVKADPNFPKE
jgi:DinB superfamily